MYLALLHISFGVHLNVQLIGFTILKDKLTNKFNPMLKYLLIIIYECWNHSHVIFIDSLYERIYKVIANPSFSVILNYPCSICEVHNSCNIH